MIAIGYAVLLQDVGGLPAPVSMQCQGFFRRVELPLIADGYVDTNLFVPNMGFHYLKNAEMD